MLPPRREHRLSARREDEELNILTRWRWQPALRMRHACMGGGQLLMFRLCERPTTTLGPQPLLGQTVRAGARPPSHARSVRAATRAESPKEQYHPRHSKQFLVLQQKQQDHGRLNVIWFHAVGSARQARAARRS